MKYINQFVFEVNKKTSRLSLKNFCSFWNLVFILSFKSLRFKALEDDNILVEDAENKIFISQKLRAYFYFKSIKNRFISLGKMYFLETINFENNDVIVDCGANIGEVYNSIKQFNNKNFLYFGFEPVKSEFNLLKINTENIIDRPIALFSKSEFKKIYIHREGADSTIIKDPRYNEYDYVECLRLDNVEDLKNKSIKLLKLEAEGAELEVLLGCGDILKNIEYISADLGFELEQGTKSNEKEVTEYLLKNNFYKLTKNSRYINLFKNRLYED